MTKAKQAMTGKRKAATGDRAAGKSTRATEVTKPKKPKTVGDEKNKSFTRDQLEYLKKLKRANPKQQTCTTVPGKEGQRVFVEEMKTRDDIPDEFFGITNDGKWMIPEDAEGDGILFDDIVQWMVRSPSRLDWTDKSVRKIGRLYLLTKFCIHGEKRMEEMDLVAAKEEARAAIQASTTAAAPSADMQALVGTVGELTGAVGKLTGTVGQLTGIAEQQQSTNASHDNRLDLLTGIAEKQQTSIGQLRDTAEQLRDTVGQQQTSIGQLQDTAEQHQTSIAAQDNRLNRVIGISGKLSDAVCQLRDTATDLVGGVTTHENRLEGHDAELQNLSSQVQESERKLRVSTHVRPASQSTSIVQQQVRLSTHSLLVFVASLPSPSRPSSAVRNCKTNASRRWSSLARRS